MCAIVLLFSCLVSISLAVETLTALSGVNYYDPGQSFKGYTLFAPNLVPIAYLISMNGDLVHTWHLEKIPGAHVQLMSNGHLLAAGAVPIPASDTNDKPCGIGGNGGWITEYDWEGNKVWEYEMYGMDLIQHHTFFHREASDTFFILGWKKVSKEKFIELGRDPATCPEAAYRKGVAHTDFWVDVVHEVNRAGEIVWEFDLTDIVGLGYHKLDPNHHLPFQPNNPSFDLYASYDWSHCNTVQWDEESQRVMMLSRNFGEIYHIDYSTKQLIWRWGNRSAYDPTAVPPSFYNDGDRELFGPHHATFLSSSLVQVFDNGSERPQGSRSRVLVVDVNTDEIVWEYSSFDPSSFFTKYQGAAQRLPNGNVLITSTNLGHVFEITSEGEVVWDFISPVVRAGKKLCLLRDNDTDLHGIGPGFLANMIHRAYRYAPDHIAFLGKDLTSNAVPLVPGCPRLIDIIDRHDSGEFIDQGL